MLRTARPYHRLTRPRLHGAWDFVAKPIEPDMLRVVVARAVRKGSFTGAHRDQPGLLETAHRGTLFLDEVGEMPASMQVKLLRFLQEGTFFLPGRTQRRAEVRVVAATHRDLEAMVAAGTFREDLFYRLKGVVLRTPALAERRDDVALLAVLFLRRVSPQSRLTPDALAWLAARDWPGNVRELRSVIEVAGALAISGPVDAGLLRFAAGEAEATDDFADGAAVPSAGALDAAIAELETRMLRDALTASGGNQSEAARKLGISRVGLIKKLARLGLRLGNVSRHLISRGQAQGMGRSLLCASKRTKRRWQSRFLKAVIRLRT